MGKYPEANIRFDGFIELPDKTAYLPILPLVYENHELPLKIIQTIPANQDFSKKPDMILFNNNLALLKIIKKEGEVLTVISSTEMPLKVKLGILPQDLVVPKGLILPTELKVILGDLKIPLKEKTDKEGDIAFYNKTENQGNVGEKQVSLLGKTTENVFKLPELEFLSNKKLYTINPRDNKFYVLNSQTGRIKKTITLSSVPSAMEVTPDNRYVLVTAAAAGKVFVIDTANDEFVKSIDVAKFPSSIVCLAKTQKAYVANKYSTIISEIDLENMQVVREIPVTGYPDNLQPADNEEFIFYNDYKTGNIYQLDPKTAKVTYLFQDKNVTKIGHFYRYVISLSRDQNTLTVFDLKKGEVIKKTDVKEKPLDLIILEKMGKILVTCAGSGELNVIDMENFDVIKGIELKNSGFPGKIELVQGKAGKSRALITDYDAYEVIIYDVDTEKILGYIPVSHIVGSMVVID
ncbi:MAG: hypothetical protein A2Y25_08275 [Candidatus Melainabacteria bacterium GWF2_37_15]|nr:MAG: hypothetical protein A2Y25_08275 [Candidatus Melainabacteria bacterium GWF2_37_15]